MKRHSEHIVVNFDADAAGSNATEKYIELLLLEGMHVRVLELEGGLDPDEYIKSNGAARYASRLEKSPSYFLWLADRARRIHNMATAEGRMAGYQQVLLPAIKRVSDNLTRASIAREVADYLGIDHELVLGEFRRRPGQRADKKMEALSGVPHSQRVLLRSLVMGAGIRDTLLSGLKGSTVARSYATWPVIERILQLHEEDPNFALDRLQALLDTRDNSLLDAAIFMDASGEIFTTEQASAWLAVLRGEDDKAELEILRSRLKEAERNGDVTQAFHLLEQMSERQSARRR